MRATTHCAAKSGTLWVGTSNGLARQAGERFETVEQPAGSLVRDIFSIHVQSAGTLWLGTNDGLARLRDGRISVVRMAQGLPHNAIFQVLDDGFGYLWIAQQGSVPRAASRGRTRGRDPGYRTSLQSVLHGMSNSVKRWLADRVAAANDGKLCSRPQCVSVASDTPLRSAEPPKRSDRVAARRGVERDAGVHAVDAGPRKFVWVLGLALRVPERVRYRHRLLGYDEAWVEVGSARLATYTNLAVGDYRFEVAASSGGAWSDPPASMNLRLLPRWWETLWFRAALALSMALVFWLLLRWRLRRVQDSERRLGALVQARTRDLADQTDRLAAADREKSELLAALRQQAEALARLASEDSLTGLPNRRAFDERLAARLFERSRPRTRPLAVGAGRHRPT